MSRSVLNIVAMGMSCPVGLRWAMACAAIRARIKRFDVLPFGDDDGRELTGSVLARLDGLPHWTARWAQLLSWSLREALEGLAPSDIAQLPVVLALPAGVRGHAPTASDALGMLREVGGTDFGLSPSLMATLCEGASGGYRALTWARQHVADHGRCLVAAADSLIGARPLAALAANRRLLTEDNPDGVIPGEAAACVLLHGARSGALASIRGLGLARESASVTNDVPLRADGVTMAARSALAEAGFDMSEIDFRVSDAAGESYGFKEQALLLARLLRTQKAELPLWLPAESLGYTGAAAGLCGLVIATEALTRGRAPGPRAMAFAGNDAGDRAAVIVEAIC